MMPRAMMRPQNGQLRDDDSEALILGYIIFEVRKAFSDRKCRIVVEDSYEDGERVGCLLVTEVMYGDKCSSVARLYKSLTKADATGDKMRGMADDVINNIKKRRLG